jgi:DNA-binding response OmpR family regulator
MTAQTRVLVVEDEEITREWTCDLLDAAGYRTHAAADARSASAALDALLPHVVLLDLCLPDAEDFSLTRNAATKHCGVIIVSRKRDREHRIDGLRAGADDYLTKPCDPEELLLKVGRLAQRIRAARSTRSGRGQRRIPWTFDPDHQVWRHYDGHTQVLSEREARLFRVLCAEPGRVFSRMQLQQAVFDKPDEVTERTVDSLVGRLRRKLEDNPNRPRLLLSVYGSGYRLDPDG